MNESLHPTLHLRIRDLRRKRSLTQEELAEALGVSRQSINAMEAGRCLPSLSVILQLASYFDVSLNILVSDAFGELEKQLTLHDQSGFLPLLPSGDPALNLFETETEFMVQIQLAGFVQENISIEVGLDFLSLSGKLGEDIQLNQPEYLLHEFSLHEFSRTLFLPSPVESDQTEAHLKNGILVIKLSKKLQEKPKTSHVLIKVID